MQNGKWQKRSLLKISKVVFTSTASRKSKCQKTHFLSPKWRFLSRRWKMTFKRKLSNFFSPLFALPTISPFLHFPPFVILSLYVICSLSLSFTFSICYSLSTMPVYHFYYLCMCVSFLKNMGQSRPLFAYFHYFLDTISIIQIEKSVDGVLGIQTRGHRMVGTHKTMELWQPPSVSFLLLLMSVCVILSHYPVLLHSRMSECHSPNFCFMYVCPSAIFP